MNIQQFLIRKKKIFFFNGIVFVFILIGFFMIEHGQKSFMSFPFKVNLLDYSGLSDMEIDDYVWQHIVALNIERGNGISVDVMPPYRPTMYRSPGLAMFAAMSYKIFGQADTKYVFAAFFIAGIFLFAWVIKKNLGVLESIVFLATITFLDNSAHLWSAAASFTTLQPYYLFLGLYLLLISNFSGNDYTTNKKKAALYAFLSGIALGVMVLIRGEFIMLIALTTGLIVFRFIQHKKKLRFLLVCIFFLYLGFAFVYTPLAIRNYVQFKSFAVGGRIGHLIGHRAMAAQAVAKGMDYWEFMRKYGIQSFANGIIDTNREVFRSDPESVYKLEKKLMQEAKEIIWRNPGAYLKGSCEEFLCGNAFNPTKLAFLGKGADSYFQKFQTKKPFYAFAMLSLIGFCCYLILSPYKTLILSHVGVYYIFLNSIVNSMGCLYTTYALPIYYLGFSLFITAMIRLGIKVRGRYLKNSPSDAADESKITGSLGQDKGELK